MAKLKDPKSLVCTGATMVNDRVAFVGFHSHVAAQDAPGDDPTRVHFEVFYSAGSQADCDTRLVAPQVGWYWWPCLPGCLPDTDDEPSGPFATAEGAYLDAIGD